VAIAVDTTLDLIRVLPLALGVAVIDAAHRSGLDLTGLRDALATQTSTRGRRKAQEAIDRASAASATSRTPPGAVLMQSCPPRTAPLPSTP
jgi:hypothetical protein